MTLLEHAIRYAEKGMPVLPLHSVVDGRCTCRRANCSSPGKHPRIAHGLKEATLDTNQIRGWWRRWPNANIAIRTGKAPEGAGVFVLDIDVRHGGDLSWAALLREHGSLPETAEAITGGGGTHLFFSYPTDGAAIRNATNIAPGIDVRGDGGYIVAPPSVHLSGGVYKWKAGQASRHIKPIAAPGWILSLVRGKAIAKTSDLLEAAARYISKAEPVEQGGRNQAAFKVAGHLASFEQEGTAQRLSEDEILQLVTGWNRRNSPPLAADELAVVVKSAMTNGTPRVPHIVPAHTALEKTDRLYPSAGGPLVRAPVLINLSDVQPADVEWLWPNRIALGKVTLFIGDPGLGKSFLTLDCAARVSTGTGWPDDPGKRFEPAGVVILSAEDDLADTIRPRLDAACADVSRISAITAVKVKDGATGVERETGFSLTTDLPALEKAIVETADCRLVIIDPVTAYLGQTDSHKNAEVRAVLAPLTRMAGELGVAVVCVTHLNKSGSGPAMYRATGSVAFIATARAAWVVTKDKDDPTGSRRLMLPAKNNLGNDQTGLAYKLERAGKDSARVVWEAAPVTLSADDALGEARPGRPGPDPEKRDEAARWLRAILAEGPRPAKELDRMAREHGGISVATLRRTKGELRVESFRATPIGPWLWKLPEIHTPTTCASDPTSCKPEHLEHVAESKASHHQDTPHTLKIVVPEEGVAATLPDADEEVVKL